MRKVIVSVVALTAIGAGGYTALWFKKANDFKQSFIESVASFNAQSKPMVKDGDVLVYESVEVSGFPYSLNLSVSKPKMQVPVASLLRLIPKEKAEWEVPAGFEWVENIGYSENITFSSNLMGSKYSLSFNGDRTSHSVVNGQTRYTLVSSSQGPVTCHLEVQPAGFLEIRPIFKDSESFFRSFRAFDCNVAGLDVKDSATGKSLGTSEKVGIEITNLANNGYRNATFKVQSVKTSYTPEFDTVINSIFDALGEAQGKKFPRLPYSFSELGENNLSMDIAYNGPDAVAALSSNDVKVKLDINEFDISSKLFSSTTKLHFTIDPQVQSRKVALKLYTKSNISERYDEIIGKQMQEMLAELSNAEGKTGRELEVAQDVARLGPTESLVAALLPKFHRFGDMVLDIDLDLDTPKKEGAPSGFSGKTVLNRLNITTAPYGFTSKGEATVVAEGAPSGSAEINCLNCDGLIDDLGNYLVNTSNYLNSVAAPDKKSDPLPRELFTGIKAFVRSIAVNGSDPAAKDLNITVSANSTGEYLVSGKQVMEAAQSYMTNVAPYMPKPKLAEKSLQQAPNMMTPPQR